MKIQVVSDVHLEFTREDQEESCYPAPSDADICVCLGDIVCLKAEEKIPAFKRFVHYTSSNFPLVLYVFGNHEFYGGVLQEAKKVMFDVIAEYENVKCLDNTAHDVVLNGRRVRFLGSTLWSFTPWAAAPYVAMGLSDYQKISVNNPLTNEVQRFSVTDTNRLFCRAIDWIKAELDDCERNAPGFDDQTILVALTHHAPLRNGVAQKEVEAANRPTSHAFATDCAHVIRRHPSLKAWIFGHTHFCADFMYEQCRMVSNCKGYVFENVNNYVRDKIIQL